MGRNFINGNGKKYPKRGEIYWVDLNPAIDGETKKTRPGLIVLIYTGSTSNVPFGLKRKLPRFSDRKWVNIKSIWTHLRSQNPGYV